MALSIYGENVVSVIWRRGYDENIRGKYVHAGLAR